MARVMSGARPYSPSRSTQRQFADPWLTYIIGRVGDVDGIAIAAFAIIQDMRASGVEVTETLADWVCAGLAAGDKLPAIGEQANFATRLLARKLSQVQKTSVYFMQMGDRIKIGISRDPERRLKSMSLPESALLFYVDGDYALEQWMHRKLADHRIDGSEWFRASAEVMQLIEDVRRGQRP